jgi:putative tricarboxylic transport membrane protein
VRFSDAISGGFFLLLAGTVFWLTRDLRMMPGQNYGAAFFPRTIASAMALFGTILLVRGLRTAGPWAEFPDWVRSPRHVANFALVVGVLVFYILASTRLGFPLTGFVSLMVLLLWLRGLRHWVEAVVVSVGCVIAIQFLFGDLLRVPLPWGVLQPVAW